MVDYWDTNIINNPQCPHGPTLLFSRKGKSRKFYVCSAFRDRKKCLFFQWSDSASREKQVEEDTFIKLISTYNDRRKEFQKCKYSTQMSYCYTCEMLIFLKEKNEHINHELSGNLRNEDIRFPTLIMKPKQESKGESQFHFACSTLDTLYSFLSQLGVSAMLCIGCPHLYEFLNTKRKVKSMLLDIDPRYLQFYDSDHFQLFNMFNCHMFDPEGWEHLRYIAECDRILIIADPPFGGRIEALAYTLNRITSVLMTKNQSLKETDIIVLLVLPYFMEPAVQQSLPNFRMLDYKVEYRNHRQFKKRENSSNDKGSAVRLFTNASLSLFTLSEKEGYKYCDMCERWVYNENRHCFKCEACTSKNGGFYKHCNVCGKCVKQTWKHCNNCGICKLKEHTCFEKYSSVSDKMVELHNTSKKRCNRKQKKKCKI